MVCMGRILRAGRGKENGGPFATAGRGDKTYASPSVSVPGVGWL
jgi:hypothetical protein